MYKNKLTLDDKEVDQELNNFIQNQKNIEEYKLSEIEVASNNEINDKCIVNGCAGKLQSFLKSYCIKVLQDKNIKYGKSLLRGNPCQSGGEKNNSRFFSACCVW